MKPNTHDTILYETTTSSSSKNRNLLIFYLLFISYSIVLTVSVTDLDLLLESAITLPLLNVKIALLHFFIWLPILIVAFSFNLALNTSEHLQKLANWRDSRIYSKRYIQPFLLDFAFLKPNFMTKVIGAFVYMYFSSFALLAILIRCSDYQSRWMSLYHFAMMIIVLVINWFYYRKEFQWLNKKAFYLLASAFLMVGGVNLYSVWQISLWYKVASIFKGGSLHEWVMPRIYIAENTIIFAPDERETYLHSLEHNLSKSQAWKNYGKGLSLRDRKLNYAYLYKAILPKVDLRRAQLQGADLWGAQLQGANLREAQLQGANLEGAQLQGAHLLQAQLQGAHLLQAQLQGANLLQAQLQGANLREAQLQGADLWGAQLQGVGTSLTSSAFFSHLDNTSLQTRISQRIDKQGNLSKIYQLPLTLQEKNTIIEQLQNIANTLQGFDKSRLEESIRRIQDSSTPIDPNIDLNNLGSYNEAEAKKWIEEYEQSQNY